jgi:thiol-disulfide isomerase/thioredoxin
VKLQFAAFKWLKSVWIFPLLAILVWAGRAWYLKPGLKNGQLAQDFSWVGDQGQTMQLSKLGNKVILLDFWGSWCPPCRSAHPALVRLYKEYQPRGLAIVSVGIETDSILWRNAIEEDALTWPHQVLDLTTSKRFFNGSISARYGVKAVPTRYLLDDQLHIIAVDPEDLLLDQLLNQRLPK